MRTASASDFGEVSHPACGDEYRLQSQHSSDEFSVSIDPRGFNPPPELGTTKVCFLSALALEHGEESLVACGRCHTLYERSPD
jgi:hypothetical protein